MYKVLTLWCRFYYNVKTEYDLDLENVQFPIWQGQIMLLLADGLCKEYLVPMP